MKRKQYLLATLFSLVLLAISVAVLSPHQAFAQTTKPWAGACVDTINKDVATIQGIECLVGNFLNIAVTLTGIAGIY
jgi:hypothetical protein